MNTNTAMLAGMLMAMARPSWTDIRGGSVSHQRGPAPITHRSKKERMKRRVERASRRRNKR